MRKKLENVRKKVRKNRKGENMLEKCEKTMRTQDVPNLSLFGHRTKKKQPDVLYN